MITSMYVQLFNIDGHYYVYNALNRFFAEISEDMYEVLYERNYNLLPAEMLEDLVNKGISI